jgi:hypothetical protein
MNDSPVTYKRVVVRRDSFRVDFDTDEVRTALSNAVLTEDNIPDTAAFRLHDDGGATFCWDVDVDMDEPAPDQDDRTVITLVPLDPAPGPQDWDDQTMIPVAQTVKADIARMYGNEDEPARLTESGRRERLANIASGRGRAESNQEPAEGHSAVVAQQCGGTFLEGVARTFRCHLDLGHSGPCGAADGHEPEDPPKGRRRSW